MRHGPAVLTAAAGMMFAAGCSTAGAPEKKPVVLAVAWSNTSESYSYTSTVMAAGQTDAEVVLLDQIISFDLNYDDQKQLKDQKEKNGILSSEAAQLIKANTWHNSNVDEVLEGVDGVIVPGGWDVSPTLYRAEQPWHGIEADGDYCAERDVSDYLLVSYCIDHDIPVFCICRGMQMLGIVSGAEVIQDIGTYFAEQGITYSDLHRDPERKGFVPHDAMITEPDSLLHQIMKTDLVEKCPSWHHQALKDVSDTGLMVTAVTGTDGEFMIEAIELPGHPFCLGVQYHPEVSVRKVIGQEADADAFMDYETAMKPFYALADACRSVPKKTLP